jgi:hypothetical protein
MDLKSFASIKNLVIHVQWVRIALQSLGSVMQYMNNRVAIAAYFAMQLLNILGCNW